MASHTYTESMHRRDIDGLRAVAMLLILMFHLGFEQLPGGYVGVDAFFVISGFLITRNVLAEAEQGGFSFARFHLRRIRRLYPALFCTLLASAAAAFWLLSPAELERFGRSLLYSTLSVSNFSFWEEAGYFDASSDAKPLLHTWSLSVEAQFYLLWPALLVGLARTGSRKAVSWAIAVLSAASFGLALALSSADPDAGYFLLPSRIFEFGTGAACVWLTRIGIKRNWVAEMLFLAGLGLVLWSATRYTSATPFPGFHALLPCIGTALLICAGHAPLLGSLLRHRVAVALGRISYSTYLVHWPLIVFYKSWRFEKIAPAEQYALLAMSILLGGLLWKLVEEPFRKPRAARGWKAVGAGIPSLALLLAFLALSTWIYKGFPGRFPDEFFLSTDQILQERARYWTAFRSMKTAPVLDGAAGRRHIIVMGNSHAIDLVYALRQNGSAANFTFLKTSSLCFNFGTPVRDDDREHCAKLTSVNGSSPSWSRADAIYLHDHWPRFDGADLAARLHGLRKLTSADILVFGPKMTYARPPDDIAHAHMRLHSLNRFSKRFELRDDRKALNDELRRMLDNDEYRSRRIYFVDVMAAQCGTALDDCRIISETNSRFLYFDTTHLTAQGAAELGARLRKTHPALFE